MDVSIIIVNYNTKELLKLCLESIYKHTNDITFEVIVSDNGSTDGSIEMLYNYFPAVQVIKNGQNIGFGAANNRALDIATGKYIFYLNSDTELLNNAPKLFFDYFESHSEQRLASIGTMLESKDGFFIHSFGDFPTLKMNIKDLLRMNLTNILLSVAYFFRYSFKHKESKSAEYYGSVDFVTGADLFLKNNSLARFDEDFFLYSEDSRLQLLQKLKGFDRRIIKGPRIIHYCGGSVGTAFTIKRKASFSRIQFEFSRLLFLDKRYNMNTFLGRLIKLFIKFLVLTSWCNPFLINKTRKYFKSYLKA